MMKKGGVKKPKKPRLRLRLRQKLQLEFVECGLSKPVAVAGLEVPSSKKARLNSVMPSCGSSDHLVTSPSSSSGMLQKGPLLEQAACFSSPPQREECVSVPRVAVASCGITMPSRVLTTSCAQQEVRGAIVAPDIVQQHTIQPSGHAVTAGPSRALKIEEGRKTSSPSLKLPSKERKNVQIECCVEGRPSLNSCSTPPSRVSQQSQQSNAKPSLTLASHTQEVKKESYVQKVTSSKSCLAPPSRPSSCQQLHAQKMEEEDDFVSSRPLSSSSDCQHRPNPLLVQSAIHFPSCAMTTATSSSWPLNTTSVAYNKNRELNVDYYPKFFSRSDAQAILKQLERELPPYLQSSKNEVKIMGKVHKIPRTQAAFGDDGLSYHFSGVTVPAHPWIPILEKIRNRLVEHLGEKFNFVLVNRYKDGNDRIGEHRDDERDLVGGASIACVSFGQERDFVLRHKDFRGKNASTKDGIPERKKCLEVCLKHGSLLVMKHPTNRDWYHSVPVRKSATAPRISLTFRVMKR